MIGVMLAAAVVGQPLWKDLHTGMTRAEVEALHPTGRTMLTPNCEARVIARYEHGALNSVWLRFGDLMAAGRARWDAALECQNIVRSSITERYGQPIAHEEDDGRNRLNAGDRYLFVEGTLRITFYTQRGRPFTVITYEQPDAPRQPARPEAAGNL